MRWKRKSNTNTPSHFSSGSGANSSGSHRGGTSRFKRGKYNTGGGRWKCQSGDDIEDQATPTPATGRGKRESGRGRGRVFPNSRQNSPDWPSSPRPEEHERQEEEEEQEEDYRKQRVLCLHAPNGGSIAASFYEPETRKLQVMEDTRDTRNRDLAMLVMEQTEPTDIVLSTMAPDSLVKLVEQYCDESPTCTSSIHPSKFFGLPPATMQLANVRIPGSRQPIVDLHSSSPSTMVEGMENDYPEQDAGMGRTRLSLVKLGCWINVDAPATVCATGALLNYLAKKVPSSEGALDVTSIESMALEQHMLINNDALTSLGIFDADTRATGTNRRQKDSLSLFGMLNGCITPLGKRLLHTWFLRPLMNLEAIAERHNAVAAFAKPANSYILIELCKVLGKIKNVPRVCTSLRRGRQGFQDWKALVEALQAAQDVKEHAVAIAQNQRVKLPVVQKVARAVNLEIFDLGQDIVQTIDWDATNDVRGERRVCIRVGVDPELDKMKAEYNGHSAVLSKVGARIVSELPPQCSFQDLSVIYLPQFGHLIQVAFKPGNEEVPDTWHRNWNIGDDQYFSNEQTDDLNAHYGDMYNTLVDRERTHIQRLVDSVRELEPAILEAMDAIAELDCIQAFASSVSAYNLVRPVMTEEPVLKIQSGRHLLQERVVTESQYVSNDTILGGGLDSGHVSMMIVTGANGSGKSAYGKQVALIAYMAQIGCFVPAKKATIGVCDKIFTRVQTKESVSRMSSAFMIDLSQVSHALRGATNRSLIILDEFGKGTIPSDGAGLLAGVIQYLIEAISPRTIVLTHFHELFTQQFLSPDLPILFCHMKTLAQEGDLHLTYLFKLSPTASLHSYAAECALAHGVPHVVVERARYVTQCIMNFEIHKLLDAEFSAREKAETIAAEYLVRQFLEWKIDDEAEDALDRLQDMLDQANAMEKDALAAALGQDQGGRNDEDIGETFTPPSARWARLEQPQVEEELVPEQAWQLAEPEFVEGDGDWNGDMQDSEWASEGAYPVEASEPPESQLAY